MKRLDLRSDTVTLPCQAMRRAMASAEVGDDVYGEDPSIERLQQRAAQLLGKPASLFFPSGSMANQAALRAHTRPGDVVLASRDCHLLRYETGAAAALSGLQVEMLGADGAFDGDDVRAGLRAGSDHIAPTTVLAVENTHNAAGGRVFPQAQLESAVAAARGAGLALHLDGARLWNAAIASGRSPAELAAPFDSVSTCLSKGLGAPVGSLVSGSAELIARLRRIRKMLGGGMRQAGVLAAAGLYALSHNRQRLAEDHANARRLAEGLAALGFAVEGPPQTNIVMFRVKDQAAFAQACGERALLINAFAPGRFRAVLHLNISAADTAEALDRLSTITAR